MSGQENMAFLSFLATAVAKNFLFFFPSMDSGKRKVNMQTVFIPRVYLIDLCRYKVDTTPSVQKSHVTPFVNETGLPELGAKSPNN